MLGISLFVQSCSWGAKDILGRVRNQFEGTYKASVAMSNNDTFSITLNEDRSFHEHNYWGDMYGCWGIAQSSDFIRKICLSLWTESISSCYHFHNDDGIPIEAAVYYYSGERNERNVVRVRDRDGDSVPIISAYFYDRYGNEICEYHRDKVNTYAIEIPPSTIKMQVYFPWMIDGGCVCKNYCKDSGDVIFVLVPNYGRNVSTRIRSRNKITIEMGVGTVKMKRKNMKGRLRTGA